MRDDEEIKSQEELTQTKVAISIADVKGNDELNGKDIAELKEVITKAPEAEEKPYTMVEQMPQFPGGDRELLSFIAKNLRYPTIAQENGIQGKVFVRFVVSATGDVKDELKSILVAEGFNVYCNTAVTQTGFDESLFNTKDKKSRYIDTLNMLLDMDILIHSSFFIGTYTSNVSRIVPLYVGFGKSLSLDDEWNFRL